jgi:signal transduction histidine kinase
MRLSKKQWLLMQITALLVITGGAFLVKPYLAKAETVSPSAMAGLGLVGMPYLITNCEDLQDVQNNLNVEYALANNIDCSDTVNWNSGSGFTPIGQNGSPFNGRLDGKGYTISNIYISQAGAGPSDTLGYTGIFAESTGRILNFNVTNATIIDNSNSGNTEASTGGVVGRLVGGLIDRVSFNGDISVPACDTNMHIGGIVGKASTNNNWAHLNFLSSTGSITVTGSDCGTYQTVAGGIIGYGDYNLGNSFSTMDISLTGDKTAECMANCGYIGGLIGVSSQFIELTSSYYAGSLAITTAVTPYQAYSIGGLIGWVMNGSTITGSFAVPDITKPADCPYVDCGPAARSVGAIVGADAGASASGGGNWANIYFDQTVAGTTYCANNSDDTNYRCNVVNTDGLDPDYFKGLAPNEPMLSSFDLTTPYWQLTSSYPTLINNSVQYAGAPTNVTTAIESTTSISLSWTASSPAAIGYEILCRPVNGTWTYCQGGGYDTDTSVTLTGLLPATQYEFMIIPTGTPTYVGTPSSGIFATTATPGVNLISDCQGLQNIQDELGENYELSRNIDCSDTITWNDGAGFDPIGEYDPLNSVNEPFEGVFAGNNYTISNLYCDQSTEALTGCALFAATNNAIIQDVKIVNPQLAASYLAGAVAAIANNGEFINIQVTGAQFSGPLLGVGGLIGALITNDGAGSDPLISKSSFTGTIDTMAYGGIFMAGGLVGTIQAGSENAKPITITNNYANLTLNAIAATTSGGLVGFAQMPPGSIMSNNYAAGSITLTSSDPEDNPVIIDGFPDNFTPIGGLMGLYVAEVDGSNITINNNFAHMALDSQSPEKVLGGGFGVVTQPRDFSSNYFDADQAGTTTCSQFNDAGCNPISGQPDYFKNNSTNPPLNAWDFTSIWMTTSEFPVFGRAVTSGITTIPPERLNPPVDGGSGQTPGPEVSPVGDTTEDGGAVTTNNLGGLSITQSDEAGVLGAIKKFVRSLPASVVVAFPYALVGLLFIAAFVLLIELMRELRRIQALQLLITKQRVLAEERDAFWHLAANYLRAPVTLIVGGAEALREATNDNSTTAIATLASSLQQKVAGIMAKIEGSTSLQAISQVQPRKVTQIARRAIFIIPVVSVATLAILGNYAASSYRNLDPGFVGYATQLVGFVIATILFYWVLSLLTQGKSKRKAAQELLDRQTNELANARHELINETAGSLNPDLTRLEGMLHALPAAITATAPGAITTLSEGASRLREIVNSFSMLIKVQEGTGAVTATPEASTVDLSSILARTRAKLTPQITAKRVQVSAPAVPLAVHAEADLANQVLESIIANAVDYSPEGGTVKVEARRLQDAIQVRVSDQGQGIDKKQLDHLFQPFVRADGKSAMDMSHGGFGINLYLDKLIMEQLGGSIKADSTPGKGTSITMTWPTA